MGANDATVRNGHGPVKLWCPLISPRSKLPDALISKTLVKIIR